MKRRALYSMVDKVELELKIDKLEENLGESSKSMSIVHSTIQLMKITA